MKNKFVITIILSLLCANCAFAEYDFVDSSDYTGDAFFTPPALQEKTDKEKNNKTGRRKETTPPIKKLRLKIDEKVLERKEKQSQLAPVDPEASIYKTEVETSDFASKEVEENFDENMMPDGFDADEESIEESRSKHWWNKPDTKTSQKKDIAVDEENTENIVLDCENMDYDTETYCLYANGNVNVEFVKQNTVVKADKITYDRMNNTIKAEGNVRILKNGQTITGEYIFVDMNEENALIENPVTQTANIQIRAARGYVYGDKIVQESGSIVVDQSFPVNFRSANRGPNMEKMIVPKNQTLTEDMEKGIVKVQAKEIKITQKGDLEVLAIKHTSLSKGKHTIIKLPGLKVYTNKNNDYVETNSWELGSYRGLGMFVGPGFVFELPKGSVLKAIPMLNYHHKIGVGGIGRFNSGTNMTQVAYGTAQSKILVRGKQRLDDNLFLQYSMNDYTNEWFLGRRRPKYGLDLVYEKGYSSNNFLYDGHTSSYTHRFDMGYFHDMDKDKNYGRIRSNQIGTTRFRYMAEASQNLYKYRNEEKQTALTFDAVAQLSAAVYGTGDTQFIGRIGPRMHTQWRRWMQDIGYYQSVSEDNSPVPVFDAYRYGNSNVYLREYFRLCKYLTLAWFGSMNLSGDSPNGKHFQENSFYVSIGPDDVKFNLGYDFIRENTFFTVQMMMDAKGTRVDYDKLVIKQDKKSQSDDSTSAPKKETSFENSKRAPVLQKAIVEDIKPVEDVL